MRMMPWAWVVAIVSVGCTVADPTEPSIGRVTAALGDSGSADSSGDAGQCAGWTLDTCGCDSWSFTIDPGPSGFGECIGDTVLAHPAVRVCATGAEPFAPPSSTNCLMHGQGDCMSKATTVTIWRDNNHNCMKDGTDPKTVVYLECGQCRDFPMNAGDWIEVKLGQRTINGVKTNVTPEMCAAISEAGLCHDNVDNDHDGVTDCADPQCQSYDVSCLP